MQEKKIQLVLQVNPKTGKTENRNTAILHNQQMGYKQVCEKTSAECHFQFYVRICDLQISLSLQYYLVYLPICLISTDLKCICIFRPNTLSQKQKLFCITTQHVIYKSCFFLLNVEGHHCSILHSPQFSKIVTPRCRSLIDLVNLENQ